MISNHHLSYHKQNILSSQDGGPICNVGRGAEVPSASAFVSPLPQPLLPHLDQLLPLSSQPQTVFLKGQRLPQQEARSPPRGCLSEPLLLPSKVSYSFPRTPPVPSASGPSLARSCLPRPPLPLAPPLHHQPALPQPSAREPGDVPSLAPPTCATRRPLSPLQRLPGKVPVIGLITVR